MKKITAILLSILVLTGCSMMMSTPTREVEKFLGKYQKHDNGVIKQLENVIYSNNTLTENQKKEYKNLMKRQYQDLSYKIKDEKVDGDNAIVEVEIEVYDYYKAIKDSDEHLLNNNKDFYDNDGVLNTSKFMDYKINKMKDVKDKVTYTLNLTLTKKDKEWKMNDISNETREKIHGIYKY